MAIKQLFQDLYIIRGLVNVYIFETDDGLVVLDTGFPGTAPKILKGIRELGHQPGDVRHIVLTHAHPDHIGSVAALKRETGATVWAHPIDAPIVEAGKGFRHVVPSPGFRNRLLTPLLLRFVTKVEPTPVDRFIDDGDRLPFLPDLIAMHSPGHCAGQIAFHWQRHEGILFSADTCVNMSGLTLPVAIEDLSLAYKSLARLAKFDFQRICFMHGTPIMADGDTIFRQTSFGQ